MWELIQANKQKSILLFLSMGVCLLLLGYLLGAAFFPPDGAILGLSIASIIWAVLSLVSFFSGDQILLATSNAKEISRDVHPQLFNVVEEMRIAANLPALPKIYIMDEAAPNAFATGRKAERSAIAVTTGLLTRLNRDELQGVIGHEMSHIMNRDVLFMTFSGILLGCIVLISDAFFRGARYSSGSSKRYRGGSGQGQAQALLLLLAIVFVILAPIAARLLYFAISRRREYLADACGARLTRYPEGLARALEKISASDVELTSANAVTAPMYIASPFGDKGRGFSGFLSTHPPIEERIKILRNMSQGVSYLNYQRAYASVTGESSPVIPPSGLKETQEIPVRTVTPEPPKEQKPKDRAREIGDLTRAVHQYSFLTCRCGLKIKVPPDFNKPKVICPRCFQTLDIPVVGIASASPSLRPRNDVPKGTAQNATVIASEAKQSPRVYVRKGEGWESFSCACGKLLQISPRFSGTHLVCDHCGQRTEIKNNAIGIERHN